MIDTTEARSSRGPGSRSPLIAALLVTLAASGCGDGPAPRPVAPPSLEGLWLADGYGTFAEIGSSEAKVFEVTAVSCLPTDDVLALSPSADGVWTFALDGDPAAGTITLDSDAVFRLQPTGTASYRTFRRIDSPPESCDRPTENTPLANFDVFWTTYREHYPLFERKGVDWDDLREEIRPRIGDDTTPEELFDLLAGMIAPFEDAHTSMRARPADEQPLDREFQGMRADPVIADAESPSAAFALLEERFARALEFVESRYAEGELRSYCQGHLRVGRLPGDVLYLWLDQEGGYTDSPAFADELAAFEEALDAVFAEASDATGLIVDVRKNYGGSDILSLALASRLTAAEYLAYAKVARLDPDDPERFTPPQERFVEVSDRPGFHGPVVQLIGPYTVSAGETLTQSLMGRQPPIVRVGENTQGVFSDVLNRRLPNGWTFGLPNELFLTADGTYFDGPGIAPDVEVPVFHDDDLEAGRDPALEKALELLAGDG